MTKTPNPKKPGGAQDAKNMGGPAFHPDMPPTQRNRKDTPAKKPPMDILKEDQVPPL